VEADLVAIVVVVETIAHSEDMDYSIEDRMHSVAIAVAVVVEVAVVVAIEH
jgi:hypothetical protein